MSYNTNSNTPRGGPANGRPAPPASKFRPPPASATPQPRQPQANTFHAAANTSAKAHVPEAYSAEEEQRIQKSLNKVLGPEYVSFRPGGGGQNVSYIEGWKALNLANEVFGFNGWSSQVVSVQVDFMDSLGGGRVSLGLSVVVRITIRDGTFHEDIGYGFIENAKGKAVAFEKCKKEAFTDGLKRCLRCFGNVLGNCLYDKSIVAKMQKVKLPEPELQSDDFHRDPLVVKRENERAMKAMQKSRDHASAPTTNGAQSTAEQGSTSGQVSNSTGQTIQGAPAVPAGAIATGNGAERTAESASSVVSRAVKDYDLDDFDESFEFSDDLPADGENLDFDMDLGEAKSADGASNTKQPAPEQVFFTSSKKAIDLQKDPEQNNIPVYDHKFVASSVKRTVDPFKSQKVRRSDIPVTHTPSQINSSRVGTPGLTPGPNGLGKRPLGMPPSQRQQPKRLHTNDTGAVGQ